MPTPQVSGCFPIPLETKHDQTSGVTVITTPWYLDETSKSAFIASQFTTTLRIFTTVEREREVLLFLALAYKIKRL